MMKPTPPIVSLPGVPQDVIDDDQAYNQGHAARVLGKSKASNPYIPDTDLWVSFNRGWDENDQRNLVHHHILQEIDGWRIIKLISEGTDCQIFCGAEERRHVLVADALRRAQYLEDAMVAGVSPS